MMFLRFLFLIIIAYLALSFDAISQTTVTFSAKAASGGQAVTLDSVLVFNMTNSADSMLIGSNKIDLESITVGNEDNITNENFSISNIYPLDFSNNADFSIVSQYSGLCFISVTGINGEEIARKSFNIEKGKSEFSFNCSSISQGAYLISARLNNLTSVSKFIKNSKSSGGTCDLCLLSTGQSYSIPSRTLIPLLSDKYLFIGYAKGFQRGIISAVPNNNDKFEFSLLPSDPPDNITVDPDLTNKVSVMQDTITTSISLTDKLGYTWTLIMQPQPDIVNDLVSMTAVKSVTNANPNNKFYNAIVFEPDGKTFAYPATLIVKKPKNDKSRYSFFTFDTSGSIIDMAEADKTDDSIVVKIYHFSGAGNTDGAKCEKIQADYAEMVNKIKNATKSNSFPWFPPTFELRCKSKLTSKDFQKAKDYALRLAEPEYSLMKDYLAVVKNMLECDPNFQLDRSITNKLCSRMANRAKSFLEDKMGQEEYYIVASYSALMIQKMCSIIGFDVDFAPLVNKYTGKVKENYFSKLRDDHDFGYIMPVMLLANYQNVMGYDKSQETISELYKVLRFEMDVTNDVNSYDSEGNAQWSWQTEVKTVLITFDTTSSSGALTGQKSANYLKGTFNASCNMPNGDSKPCVCNLVTKSFQFIVDSLIIDDCDNHEVTIRTHTFGTIDPGETWNMCFNMKGDCETMTQQNIAGLQGTMGLIYQNDPSYNMMKGYYRIKFKLKGGSEILVDDEKDVNYKDDSDGNWSSKLKVKIVHKPK